MLLCAALTSGCKNEGKSPSPGIELAAPPDLAMPPGDAQTTASGLVTRVLKEGSGERRPRAEDSVRVHYAGWKSSGSLIDSSIERGVPGTFPLSGVIPGWAEGLQLMRVGERRRLWIPQSLSYTRPGRPPSTVVFDIELLEIIEGGARPAPPDIAAPPESAKKTESGLTYALLHASGESDRPSAWDRVTLSYAGWTTDGQMLEGSSRATFDVEKVMPGWREALQLLAAGDRARVWIPESLTEPRWPRGTLVFDFELLSIERRPEPPRTPEHVAAPPPDAERTPSGLAYRFLARGAGGARPGASSRVRLHYSGWTTDGALFDSSVTPRKPRTVSLRGVMAGWRQGLQLMAVGDKALFWIPELLAYRGAAGAPRGTLVYEIELLEILE
jgi:FKBP-type peptidyl-prolyl cis-trans isomerase